MSEKEKRELKYFNPGFLRIEARDEDYIIYSTVSNLLENLRVNS